MIRTLLGDKLGPQRNKIGTFKYMFVRNTRHDIIPIKRIDKFLNNILKPKSYIIRVYILKGINLSSTVDTQNPKTFLKVHFNEESVTEKESMRQGNYPEYYRSYQFIMSNFPGTGKLRVEIFEQKLLGNSLLGYTEVDVEDRIFSVDWNKFSPKPIEKRNVQHDVYGSRGRLEM